jgi:aspartate aminotransferase
VTKSRVLPFRNKSQIINQKSQIRFTSDDVLVSIGAKMAIYNAIQTLINPGDEVIIPMPSWVSYTEMVKLAEGKVVPVQTTYEDNYLLTPHQLRAALSERTRMLILCSPNNPTGSVYSRAQLQALIDVLRDFPNVTILSDEIYRCLTYGCEAPGLASFPELQDRLVIVNGVSKAYAMTGYRIGWLLSKNRDFLSACTRLQGQQLTCATMVAQKAAEAALTGPQDCVVEMRQTFAERRELICRLASEVPGFRFREPQGAFYLFPDVSAIGSGDEVAERLLDEAHVAVVSGSAFGCPECIRLSYAISTEEIEEAMRRIKIALS